MYSHVTKYADLTEQALHSHPQGQRNFSQPAKSQMVTRLRSLTNSLIGMGTVLDIFPGTHRSISERSADSILSHSKLQERLKQECQFAVWKEIESLCQDQADAAVQAKSLFVKEYAEELKAVMDAYNVGQCRNRLEEQSAFDQDSEV